MKKLLRTIFITSLFSSATTAQTHVKTGLRAGVNISNYQYHYPANFPNTSVISEELNNAALLTLAVPVEVAFTRHFAVQAELNFIQKGYKTHYETVAKGGLAGAFDKKLVVNWLEIPFLTKIKFGTKTGVSGGMYFGPSMSFALSGHIKYATVNNFAGPTVRESGIYTIKFPKEHTPFDWGFNLGGDINYRRFFFDMRYQLGLKDMDTWNSANNSGLSITTRGLALSVGYWLFSTVKKSLKVVKK